MKFRKSSGDLTAQELFLIGIVAILAGAVLQGLVGGLVQLFGWINIIVSLVTYIRKRKAQKRERRA